MSSIRTTFADGGAEYVIETWKGLTICPLEPYEFVVDPRMNEMYLESMEAHHPRYLFSDRRPALVHPGLLLNRSNDTRSPTYRIPSTEAGIHAKDDVHFGRPAKVGERLVTSYEYVDRYERRGRPYVVVEATIAGDHGEQILRRQTFRTITTDSNPISSKMGVANAPDQPIPKAVVPVEESATTGPRVYGRAKLMTLERLQMFSGPKKNIHTDEAAARDAGLPSPIASATQSMGHVCELMIDYFGENFLKGGRLKATFVRPILVGDLLRYEGHIAANDGGRYRVEITGLNQHGQPVTLASAESDW